MNSHFLNGFAAELTKEAAHPLFSSVKKGGTLLGKQVRGMISRAMKRGKVKKHRMKKKAEAPSAKFRAGANSLSPTELRVMERANMLRRGKHGHGGDKHGHGSGDKHGHGGDSYGHGGDKYGGGAGNFEGKQAPAFTADTKKGKIGNPSENPQNFGKKAMPLGAARALKEKIKALTRKPDAKVRHGRGRPAGDKNGTSSGATHMFMQD